MTISTTTSRASYNGNGVTTVFSVPFRFFANTDLVVELVTVSTGASATLTLTTHYTVTGADEEDGGSLTMLTAPAVGERLVIRRVIAATQEVDYVAGDPFPAETHERALDRLTMLAQQGEEVNARALVFPSGDTASGELPAVATRANKLLGFNSSGELTVSAPASGSAAELALDLASTVSGKGAEMVGYSSAISYAAGTVGFQLNQRKAVFATGVAATDVAAIQDAVTGAADYDCIDLIGNFSTNAAIVLKPKLMLNFVRATLTHTNSASNVFEYLAGTPAGFPGRIVLMRPVMTGPGAASTSCAFKIDANSPFCEVVGGVIYGFETGIYLRDAYCSAIRDTSVTACAHGIRLYRESHAVLLQNNFVDSCTVAGLSINYGGGVGTGTTHDIRLSGGAYQNCPVGIWAEMAQEMHGHVYFEGNTVNDMRIGVADAGVYARSCYNIKIDGFSSASGCATDTNVRIEHSVGVYIGGAGFNSGTRTTGHVVYVDGFSDFVHIDPLRVSTVDNPISADDPTRVLYSRTGRKIIPDGMKALEFGVPGSVKSRIWQEGVGGRDGINIEALVDDVRLRAQDTVLIQDNAGNTTAYFDVASKVLVIPAGSVLNIAGVMALNGAEHYAAALPTTNPGVAGRLWVDPAAGNAVKRS